MPGARGLMPGLDRSHVRPQGPVEAYLYYNIPLAAAVVAAVAVEPQPPRSLQPPPDSERNGAATDRGRDVANPAGGTDSGG